MSYVVKATRGDEETDNFYTIMWLEGMTRDKAVRVIKSMGYVESITLNHYIDPITRGVIAFELSNVPPTPYAPGNPCEDCQ